MIQVTIPCRTLWIGHKLWSKCVQEEKKHREALKEMFDILGFRKSKSRWHWDYTLHPSEWVKSKSQAAAHAGMYVELVEHSFIVGGSATTLEIKFQFLRK